jgi:hypothetical protein
MPPRTRKLLGAIALLAFLTVYVLIAMMVAIVLQVRGIGGAGEAAFYILAGLVWVLPAGVIVQWMQKSVPVKPRA